MKHKKKGPPGWAQRLLELYCRQDLLEDLEGDLTEYFNRNLIAHGRRKARLIYIVDVFKFFRIYTLRKPSSLPLLIEWIMLTSYIKTSGRTIMRNKLFSFINIIGLAVSMSVGLVMIGVLVDMYSYDKFHQNHDRIYRVISRYEFLNSKDNDFNATTSLRAAKAIKSSFTGMEAVAILHRGFRGDVGFGEKNIPLSGFWSNETLFDVFSFALVEGNPTDALKEPFSIVLTEESARRVFGKTDVTGKIITLDNDRQYTVTGVMKDLPRSSHMHFEMLASLSTREITEKENTNEMAWDNVSQTWVYILMPPKGNLKAFQAALHQLSAREDPSVKNTHIELALQPMDDIMMGENLSNQIGPTMGSTLMWVFSALSFVVLLSACFNYTNLSAARSLKRSREVGIRKVIGALKAHIVGQFVMEAVMISLFSLFFAFVIFLLIKPHFINMEPGLQQLLSLELSPLLITSFVFFALLVGVFAGLFPALMFSRVNAIQTLKNLVAVRLLHRVTARKALLVFQYCISLMLITGTLIIFQQYKHFIAYDLGFTTENILNIKMQGNKVERLKKVLQELPEIKGMSQSALVTSLGSYWGTIVKSPDHPEDSANVHFNMVDENYIPLHDHHLLAGRNFLPRAEEAKENEVIVNEQVLKRFDIGEQIPTKAIGERLTVGGNELRIIGVMKDFEYGRANNRTSEKGVLFRYSSTEAHVLNVKIHSEDLPGAYAKIESLWKKMDPDHPFQAKFYDDEIQEAFVGLSASVKLAGFMSFLAICIASLGLLGMVVFTTETRMKEVSIRKVLGASVGILIYLLGKGFFMLLILATAIALPVTYLFFDKILLPGINNHAPLTAIEGMIGVLSVMSLAIIMIGMQAIKVARSNPAEVLKSE